LNLWSIAPENDFLAVLAAAVRDGSLLDGNVAFDLPDWTILVPTRRAARALSAIFLKQSGRKALLLPRIRPIGDIDEDTLADSVATDALLPAISTASLTHLMVDLVTEWAAHNPQAALAQDIARSPQQSLQLALSLQQLLNQIETEETSFANLELAYDLDLAGHRSAILGLLDVIAKDLPHRLQRMGHTTPSLRRNQLLRLEAERIAKGEHKGPMVAAGSTGTNPAARELLRAIALKENGAVVLPGLDLSIDEETWNSVTPQHPQHAMKMMLDHWQVQRKAVKPLGRSDGHRRQILSDMMLPAAATDSWQSNGSPLPDMENIALIAAHDRHEEALVIALQLKKFLAIGEGTAALITPDRDLAQRVAVALKRWGIAIDDSSGEALAQQPVGSLLAIMIRARLSDFASADFLALMHHPLATFGNDGERAGALKEMVDACCFRGMPASRGLANLENRIGAARERAQDHHAHPLLKRVNAEDWDELAAFAVRIVAALTTGDDKPKAFAAHIGDVRRMLAAVAPQDGNSELDLLLEALEQESAWEKPVSFAEVAPVLLHHLATTPVRPPLEAEARISILGLLEARLVPLDLAILGGLNDGQWPQLADTGPWLNRSMRETLSLSQPERNIGITAHDFVQGFGRARVMVTWSQRIGGKPSLPSRWILRLRAVLQLRGLKPDQQLTQEFVHLARRLDEAKAFTPWSRPAVRPEVLLRPTNFSVTEIELLVRDSYAVFAKRILELEPMEEAEAEPDARLRGTLVHAAIGQWLLDPYDGDYAKNLERLLSRGREVFSPYLAMPEVARLWWPRFERMARELIHIERELRENLSGLHVEEKGKMRLDAGGVEHQLRARADRIDVLTDGSLRIIDYKTGAVPSWKQVRSGFNPQLTLETAIAERGGFASFANSKVSDLAYILVGGGEKAADISFASPEFETGEIAVAHLQSLTQLLSKYQLRETAYMPRHNLFREEDRSNFDHLSRLGEWRLATRNKP
jgi:ATP-dependent helicase/nuclease subunit B